MSIKYELSRWVDYPGATGLKEEKLDIIAATGMDASSRARNIVLKREYTGKNTLEFDIPVKYIDSFTGEWVYNPLCKKIIEKTKIKLWRDEKWWNPFGGESEVNEETGCTEYKGTWEQGRWYDFVVSSHKEKRSKKQLLYSYKCDSLFMNELSRNGYSLQFVADTDLMAANGMGTAHDLARRIVDGTEWQYIKTETFPDYKEEFNMVTGETVKLPVATDQIEFINGLDRYGYCYEVTVDDSGKRDEILNNIKEQLTKQGLTLKNRYGFTNNKFWWKPKSTDDAKDYVYNYQKTENVSTVPDTIFCADDGGKKYYTELDNWNTAKLTGVSNFGDVMNAWEPVQGTTELITSGTAASDNLRFYMQVKPVSNKAIIKYSRYEGSLNSGDRYAVAIRDYNKHKVQFEIWDHNTKNDYSTDTDAIYKFEVDASRNNGDSVFCDTYYISITKHIANPVFVIRTSEELKLSLIYIYKFIGSTKPIEEHISKIYSAQNNNIGIIAGTNGLLNVTADNWFEGYVYPGNGNIYKNLMQNTSTGVLEPIWLGFNRMSSASYINKTEVYPIEFNEGGKYYQIYLPLNQKDVVLKKLSSAENDKRRAISGEKSNRFTLLETVAKTFKCFTRFMVDHDSTGKIIPGTKRFTYVSELGKKQLHGFNYGVNLETIERTIEAENVVTKMHVESLENQYSDSNMITIQDSIHNKFGMTFLYNFNYYINRGLINKQSFLEDYQNLITFVGARNAMLKDRIAAKLATTRQLDSWKNKRTVLQLSQNSIRTLANEALEYIHWDYFVKHHAPEGTDLNFPNIELNKFTKGAPIGYLNGTTITFMTGGKYKEVEKLPNSDYYTYTTTKVNSIDKTVLKPYVKADDKGKQKVPVNFNNVKTLSEYMSFNVYDKQGDDKWPDYTDASQYWGGGLSASEIEIKLNTIFSYQDQYKKNESELDSKAVDSIESNIETQQAEADRLQTDIDKLNKEIQAEINKFENHYINFIIEGQWQGKDYIDADTYYIDATRAHAEACMPKVSYSIGAIDLSQIANPLDPEDTAWGEDFIYDVGDTSYVKDQELFGNTEQLTMIAAITSYVDDNKQDNLDLRNYETRFEELFQQISASVTSVQMNENIWGKAASFDADGTINENILKSSIAKNNNLVISSANNSVTQNNFGLTITDTTNGMNVMRAIAGGIFFSNDGGFNFKTGLTPEGLSASLITAGRLDTSKIVIRNDDTPLFSLDSQGLTGYGVAASNSFTRFDQFGIYGTNTAAMFTHDWWKPTEGLVSTSPEEYIANNSIFSLTKLGLNFRYEKENENGYKLTFGSLSDGDYGIEIVKGALVAVRIDSSGYAHFAEGVSIGGYINTGEFEEYKKQQSETKQKLEDNINKAFEAADTAEDNAKTYADTAADTAEKNAKAHASTLDSELDKKLTKAYKDYANSEIAKTDTLVAKHLSNGSATTLSGTNFMISPYIGGGYLNITNGSKKVIIDPKNLSKTGYIFQVHNGSEISLGITASGDATFAGTITARDGQIGGWKIASNALQYRDSEDELKCFLSGTGTQQLNKTVGTHTGKDWTIWSNGTFGVTNTGKLYATSGDIGGWTMDGDFFYKANNGNMIAFDFGSVGVEKKCFAIGQISKVDGSWSDAKFAIDGQGKLYASAGTIGGWTLDDSKLYAGSNSTNSSYFYILSEPDQYNGYIGAKDSEDNWCFKVDCDGHLHATGATITGTLQAGSVLLDGVKLGTGGKTQFKDYDYDYFTGTTWSDAANYGQITCSRKLTNSGVGGYLLLSAWSSIKDINIMMDGVEGEGVFGGKWRVPSSSSIVTSSSGTITSDVNKKHEISTLSSKYSILFDNLHPVTYKYNDGTSDRLHTGFIAQEVNAALQNAEIDSKDFAGLVIFDRGTEKEEWTLRYSEFIALNTSEIQKAKARISELESRIFELEYKLASLTNN